MTAGPWPTNRTCSVCAVEFFPKSTVQVYCSAKCRERAKYNRVRSDPVKWAAYLAKDRERYEPRVREVHLCEVEACEEKHLARGMCRRHYRRSRYRQGFGRRRQSVTVSALVKRYDESGEFIEEPTARRILATVGQSLLFPECPDCGRMMRRIKSKTHDLRDCGACRVRAMLNKEEVEWLTSEARSTEPPSPTPN